MKSNLNSPITRRRAITVGSAAFGLTLPRLLANDALHSGTMQPRAKSVILLYLSGGPSQLDMWDLKPNASEEIRGTFRPINTNVPGIQVSEHMPRMAKLADKYTIVRSMSHTESEHLRAGYWVMTGGRLTRPITAFSEMTRNDHPHIGAVVSKQKPARGVPSFVTVPEFVSPRGVPRPGQHAGFLGPSHDPYLIHSDPNLPNYNPGPILAGQGAASDRIDSVRSLVASLEKKTTHPKQADFGLFRDKAFDLVGSPNVQQAFDLSRETEATRARYGRHIFCQSTLVARRLVEAGVRLVQVNFIRHDNGKGGQGYDSHSSPPNPPHLDWAKNELLPPTDSAFAALLQDLVDRNMLDETLVIMMGEFGRTPRFNKSGGRDHWPGCYSLVMAGGGVAGGHIYGESDKIAAVPTRDPVSPDDILATTYQLLGADHRVTEYDLENRPHVICTGKPVIGLLA